MDLWTGWTVRIVAVEGNSSTGPTNADIGDVEGLGAQERRGFYFKLLPKRRGFPYFEYIS